jgi:phospholipid/cholesterol/gamma-HCH transport system substrate-binding protein
MVTRKTKILFALFLTIAVVGVGYTGSEYAGLFSLFGQGYLVRLELPDSGGLFTNAEVTERGVQVGKVTGMTLTDTGAEADLQIQPSAPEIPANSRAVVADGSVVGEQFVDLEPAATTPPYLHEGSVIPASRTELPPSPQSLLTNLDGLVKSVPTQSLRITVNELGQAFNGSGPALQQLLDSSNSLVATAQQNVPQTVDLFQNTDTVLRTQEDQADEINTFSSSLLTLSAQLKKSDPDIRKLMTAAPAASGQVNDLLQSSGNDLGVLTANLLTTSEITKVRTAGIEEFLVALPVVSSFEHTLSPGDGTGHMGLVVNVDNPLPCTNGYQGTVHRPGSDTTPAPTNYNIRCDEPPNSPTDVRGSQNAPREPVPTPVAPPPTLPFQ